MKTIYDTTIANKLTSDYLDCLIDKVFALLPQFEDSILSKDKKQSFIVYQNNLIQTINGNTNLIQYEDSIVIDILSHLESLKLINNHADYRRHILKICKLLSLLKKGVDVNGI